MSYPRHPISCWCRHNFLLSNKYAAMQMRAILSAIYFFESFARISLHSRVLETYAGLLLVFFLINHLQTKIWHDVAIMINRHLMWSKSFQRFCGYTKVGVEDIMAMVVKYVYFSKGHQIIFPCTRNIIYPPRTYIKYSASANLGNLLPWKINLEAHFCGWH